MEGAAIDARRKGPSFCKARLRCARNKRLIGRYL